MPAEDRAFHRGGPAGVGPRARQIEAAHGRFGGQALRQGARRGAEGGLALFDDQRVSDLCVAQSREDGFQIAAHLGDDLLAGLVEIAMRAADRDGEILSPGQIKAEQRPFIEDPVSVLVPDDGSQGFAHDDAIKPEIDADDGRDAKLRRRGAKKGWLLQLAGAKPVSA